MVLALQGSTLDTNVNVKLDENKEKWPWSAVQTIEATLSLTGSAWRYIKGGPMKKGTIKKNWDVSWRTEKTNYDNEGRSN